MMWGEGGTTFFLVFVVLELYFFAFPPVCLFFFVFFSWNSFFFVFVVHVLPPPTE